MAEKSSHLAPSGPSFTVDHVMPCLIHALIAKSGESPSRVTRLVRQRLYPRLMAFAKHNAVSLRELVHRVDASLKGLDAHRPLEGYVSQVHAEIRRFGDELLKTQVAAALPQPSRPAHAEAERQVVHRAQPLGAIAEQLLLRLT